MNKVLDKEITIYYEIVIYNSIVSKMLSDLIQNA